MSGSRRWFSVFGFRFSCLLIAGALGLGPCWPLKGKAEDSRPLSEFDARFTPQEAPVCMNYDVGYRLCNIELRRVGKVAASTTLGRWHHRITGKDIPALFLDIRVDSPDTVASGRRNRISIHDRIIAVMTVPDMQSLLFAKYTDEVLRPIIRASEVRAVSIYDTQAGRLDFVHRDLLKGTMSTTLTNSEALLELSRKIQPIMGFLVAQYNSPTADADTSDQGRIVVNLDGKIASLRMLTRRERSPGCLLRQRPMTMHIKTVSEKGSSARPRLFQAWSMTFKTLATTLNDESLVESARHAPAETVVPLVMDYELGLGSVHIVMTSLYLGKSCDETSPLSRSAECPKPVAQE